MSHEPCDAEYESHGVRVGRRTRYKKGALGRLGVPRTISPTPPAIEISTPSVFFHDRFPSPLYDGLVA